MDHPHSACVDQPDVPESPIDGRIPERNPPGQDLYAARLAVGVRSLRHVARCAERCRPWSSWKAVVQSPACAEDAP